MDQEARIEVSLTEGRFEVVGSESFVKEQTENLKNYVVENMERIPLKQKHTDPTEPSEIGSLDTAEDGQSDLEYIFEEDEGAIRILADLPGNTNAEKTVNAALLYLYGKSIYLNEKQASTKEIREICREHACLDGNFASNLNKPSLFNIKGQSGSSNKSIRLTRPGQNEAQKLIDQLNE